MVPAFIALVCVSASSLAYELTLMRLFSIVQWYHLAYMVISIALLGFAASGTLLAIVQRSGTGSLGDGHYVRLFSIISFMLFIFIVASFYLAQGLPFTPFELVWQKKQYVYLAGYYALFFIPFFLAGSFIGLNFMRFKQKVARVYFYNLTGSGAGVAIAFLCFYLVAPDQLLIVCGALALCGFFLSAIKRLGSKPYFLLAVTGAAFVLACLLAGGIPLQVSPYKGISKALQLPDAVLEYERFSPFGLVQVVDAPSLRYAPGLSLAFTKGPPPQKELFVDGSSYGAVTNFMGDIQQLEFLDYSTFSAAFHTFSPKRVLVLNPGGGIQILAALFHGADRIQVVEPHPGIVRLLQGPLRSYSQGIYDQHPKIRVETASPRGFLAGELGSYELIELGLIGSWGGVGGGIYATGENYVYTREAFKEYFKRLEPQGMLSASAWLSSPPRVFLKLLALAVETLENSGARDASRSLVAIRGWATGTVLIKKGGFTPAEIARIRDFCEQRAFDPVYYPGIDRGAVNRFNVLEDPVYFETVSRLLHRGAKDELYENYLFNIRPPTDDKPYFFHFFRVAVLPYLVKTLGKEWIPFLEWGYVILWATLVQALIVAPILMFLPLVFIGTHGKRPSPLSKGSMVLYFSTLGLAFIFIEMGYIQKFIMVLTHPMLALGLVVCTLLVFSGMGSLASARLRKGTAWIPFAALLLLALASLALLDGILKALLSYPLAIKGIAAVILLGPLAFFMGMPFPVGLQLVSDTQSSYIPWVWGVNGVASVIAPVLGSLLSVCLGFHAVMLISVLLYGLAGGTFYFIAQRRDSGDRN
ncbi:MAG: SAM-dependent methyltransferase [Deltaproteobacteria bacterium]|nr:SAM-dependent methyltransferase [Deltaproteobacteria bacterium]